MGLPETLELSACRGFLIQGGLDRAQAVEIAESLLVSNRVVEKYKIGRCGDSQFGQVDTDHPGLFYVLPLPGVTDPQAESALGAIRQLGFPVDAVRTFCKYTASELNADQQSVLCNKLLANESIEQVITGPLQLSEIQLGKPYEFALIHVDIIDVDDSQLMEISRDWQLSLTLVEMQRYSNITPNSQETRLMQSWRQLPKPGVNTAVTKTLAGRVCYTDENGTRQFDNM